MQRDFNKYGASQFFAEIFFVDPTIKGRFYQAAADVYSAYQQELICKREAEIRKVAGPDGIYYVQTVLNTGESVTIKMDGNKEISQLKRYPYRLGLPIKVSQKSIQAVELVAIYGTPIKTLYNQDLMDTEHQRGLASRLACHPSFERFTSPLSCSFSSFRFDRVPSLDMRKVAEARELLRRYEQANEKVCQYQESIGIPEEDRGLEPGVLGQIG
jgi:hypothetical protein